MYINIQFKACFFQKNHPVLWMVFVLFFIGSQLSAQSVLEKKISFTIAQQSLPEILWALSEQSEVSLVFSDSDFGAQKYSYSFRQKSLRHILNTLLAEKPFTFSYEGGQIVIVKKAISIISISGYIEDAESGERLIGANIVDLFSGKGTSSNAYGYFSLTLLAQKIDLRISYLGYQPKQIPIRGKQNQRLIIQLKPSLTLSEVIVWSADSLQQNRFDNSNSLLRMNEMLKTLPRLGGEVDVMRILQQLPGTQGGTDGFGGLYVRGGNADQNLVLLDGVAIYNPYHALGLFSIFDHHIIKKVNYLRGQFPARFGGRISSVVDVRTKDGNNKEHHVHIGTGLIASKLAVEGPLRKERGAFFISTRRSHLDPFLKSYANKSRGKNEKTGSYNYFFGELIGKFNYSISAKDKIYLSFYYGKDDYSNDERSDLTFNHIRNKSASQQLLNWGNTIGVFRWNHPFGNKVFSNLTATYSLFTFASEDLQSRLISENQTLLFSDYLQSTYRSRISTRALRYDLDYVPRPKHYVRSGIHLSHHYFVPGAVTVQDSSLTQGVVPLPDSLVSGQKDKLLEVAFFLEDEWQLSEAIKVNAGLRAALFSVAGRDYWALNPRLSMYWQASSQTQFHFSISRMSQALHLLTRTGSGLPSDLWVPATERVAPQFSWMVDVGGRYFPRSDWELELSAYYKKMFHLINYIEGADFVPNPDVLSGNNWEDKVTEGSGSSKGIELLVRKQDVQNTAWLSYTLSESRRQFAEINGGQSFPFRFDLRHAFNLVYARKLDKHWSLSAAWAFRSGSHINLALNEWQYVSQDGSPDFIYQNFGGKNSYTLPPYHRLDISARYKKEKPWGHWSFDVGIYNLYNRKNIYFIKSDFQPGTKTLGYKAVSLIPVLPYFSIDIYL